MDWLFALLGAVGLGVLGNLVYELVKRGTVKMPRWLRTRGQRLPPHLRNHDVQRDGLVPLITWSKSRPLKPDGLITHYAGSVRRSHLFDDDKWRQQVVDNEACGDGGRTCYMTRLSMDHGEHEAAKNCVVELTESRFAQAMATHRLAKDDAARRRALDEALALGGEHFVAVVPPTSLSFSVAIVSKRNRVLVLRRSLGVRTYTGLWSIGINETMKYQDEPGAREYFFGLVQRGLLEEVGLRPNDYGVPLITWLGWSKDASCFAGVAIVRTVLDEAEVDLRRGQCHSVYEHDAAAWLKLDRKTTCQLLERRDAPDGTSNWLYLTPLVASELWRSRGSY